MSKYQPLSDRLAASPGDEWPTTFGEIESVLGFPLPKAARSGRGWWVNDLARSHSRAWAGHGWEVGEVDHAAGRVVFRRGPALHPAPVTEELPREVQPAVTPVAFEVVSEPPHRSPFGAAALATAGVAVVAGLGALLVRGLLRRR